MQFLTCRYEDITACLVESSFKLVSDPTWDERNGGIGSQADPIVVIVGVVAGVVARVVAGVIAGIVAGVVVEGE